MTEVINGFAVVEFADGCIIEVFVDEAEARASIPQWAIDLELEESRIGIAPCELVEAGGGLTGIRLVPAHSKAGQEALKNG